MTYTTETTTIPTVPGEEREQFAPSSPANRPSPLDNISAEKPRTHPVAYGALMLAALALMLRTCAVRSNVLTLPATETLLFGSAEG